MLKKSAIKESCKISNQERTYRELFHDRATVDR